MRSGIRWPFPAYTPSPPSVIPDQIGNPVSFSSPPKPPLPLRKRACPELVEGARVRGEVANIYRLSLIQSSRMPVPWHQNPLHVNELDSNAFLRSACLFPVLGHVRFHTGCIRKSSPNITFHAIFRSIVIYVLIFSYVPLCLAISCYVFAMICYVLLSAAIARFSRFPLPQNEIVNEMTSAYTFIRLSRSCENSSTSTLSFISVKEERLWLQQTRRR